MESIDRRRALLYVAGGRQRESRHKRQAASLKQQA